MMRHKKRTTFRRSKKSGPQFCALKKWYLFLDFWWLNPTISKPFGYRRAVFLFRQKKDTKKTVLSDGFLMAGATGLEPATYGVTGRHSNQTELRPRDRFVYIGFFFPLQELFSIF